MQILPGIFLVNGSPYGRDQNGYLIHRQNATILIDSGDMEAEETLPEIERNAARWGFQIEQASHLFITHAHYDHASHAARLQRRGIKLVASPETAAAMAAGDDRCIGFAHHRVFEPCQVDRIIEHGQEVRMGDLVIRGIAAPGHTNGLMVFELVFDGERCWFVGDLLRTRHAHSDAQLPWTGAPDFDKRKYIETMARLIEMPCDHLFEGHGPAAIGCGQRVLQMAYKEAIKQWG